MDNDHFRCLLCEIKQLKRTDKKSLVCCVLLHYYTPDIMCGELSRSNIYCNILMCVISSCEGSAATEAIIINISWHNKATFIDVLWGCRV